MNNVYAHVPLRIEIHTNFRGGFFDLSGTAPFELFYHVYRASREVPHTQPLTILTNGSVFDLPAALHDGIIELLDITDASKDDDGAGEWQIIPPEGRLAQQTQLMRPGFLTIPPESTDRRKAVVFPLQAAAECLRDLVKPERSYRLRIPREDIGVRWWSWGALDSSTFGPGEPSMATLRLPRGESSNLHLHLPRPCLRGFRTVSHISAPPIMETRLSLAITPWGPAAVITVRNPSASRPITLMKAGHQPFLHEDRDNGNPRLRLGNSLSAQNLVVVDVDDSEGTELFPATFMCLLTMSGAGYSRSRFITLGPGDFFTSLCRIPGNRLKAGRSYSIRLRELGCWWCQGTVDELFGGEVNKIQQLPPGPTLPAMLRSDDMVVLRVEGE
ncbi:hypothetical protein F4778DRAFT_714675 [Xylariomycetidae sp. FL2044]|nr:hypothetical protein F4778DRAFT_714675 [Xylariomycetidae sp. FL2044]